MRSFLQLPVVRQMHAKALFFPALLLLAVCGVLLHGYLHRQDFTEPAPDAEASPPPSTVTSLRPDLEKTPLTYVSDYWLQLGRMVRRSIVLIGQQKKPGIVVADGLALTSLGAVEGLPAFTYPQTESVLGAEGTGAEPPVAPATSSLASPTSPPKQRLIGVDLDLGLALVDLGNSQENVVFTVMSPANLQPGAHVAAVSLTPDQSLQIAPGYLVSTQPAENGDAGTLEISLAPADSVGTAAIVDLDGQLVGISVETGNGLRTISSGAILAIMDSLRADGICRSILTGPLSDEARKILGVAGGVVVEKVRRESFMPEPSIRQGDVLLEWGGEKVMTVSGFDELYKQTKPGSLVRYRVLRGRRWTYGGTLMPALDCRPMGESPLACRQMGLTFQYVEVNTTSEGGPNKGWRVTAVDEGSPASLAGLLPEDLVVAIDGRDVTDKKSRPLIENLDRRLRPTVLRVQRGDRVKLLAVSPAKS